MYECMLPDNGTASSGVLLTALLNQSSLFYAIELNESAVVDFSKAKKEVYVAAAAQLQGHPGIYHCIYTFYPD